MKEQLKLLIEVQRHDARIQELDGMKKVWPQKLETLQIDLKKVEALLARERAQLEETEAWRRRQELERKEEESRLLAAKQKSSLVKNAKEMMANERELQATRKMAQEREEEVLKLVGAVDTAKKSISQHEADFEALKKHVVEEEAAASSKTAELDAQIADERKLREVAAARVRPDVMKKYSTIRMRRGLALVPVKNGTCQGCNMNIPPQLFNTIQRGNSIELCGTCNRIIYWDKLLEETDGAPAEKS
ncbi:MAG: zinc ribbon domain-containing protein [Polyangia bacterium]